MNIITDRRLALLLMLMCVTSTRTFEVDCKMKPGCTTPYQCDPIPKGWSQKKDNIEEHLFNKEFSITCDNKELWKSFKKEIDNLKTEIEKIKLENRELKKSLIKENQETQVSSQVSSFDYINNLLRMKEEIGVRISPMLEFMDYSEVCELLYNQRCYRAIFHNTQNVSYSAAEKMCNKIGWKLANLYSKDHYDKVATYLRMKKSWITLWLGMTYKANKVFLSDGSTIPEDLPWYPNFPTSHANWHKTKIHITKDPNSVRQGLVNYPSTPHKTHGALCEI